MPCRCGSILCGSISSQSPLQEGQPLLAWPDWQLYLREKVYKNSKPVNFVSFVSTHVDHCLLLLICCRSLLWSLISVPRAGAHLRCGQAIPSCSGVTPEVKTYLASKDMPGNLVLYHVGELIHILFHNGASIYFLQPTLIHGHGYYT